MELNGSRGFLFPGEFKESKGCKNFVCGYHGLWYMAQNVKPCTIAPPLAARAHLACLCSGGIHCSFQMWHYIMKFYWQAFIFGNKQNYLLIE